MNMKKKDTVTPRKKAPEDLTCRICWTKFPTANHWSLHTKYVHNPPSFKCSQCPKVYKYKNDLQVHMQLKHETDTTKKKTYECPKCKKSFQLVTTLRRHIREHTDRFECRFCKKEFNTRVGRENHEKLHNEEKDIKCDHCDLKFVFKRAFARHIKEDHQDVNVKEKQKRGPRRNPVKNRKNRKNREEP